MTAKKTSSRKTSTRGPSAKPKRSSVSAARRPAPSPIVNAAEPQEDAAERDERGNDATALRQVLAGPRDEAAKVLAGLVPSADPEWLCTQIEDAVRHGADVPTGADGVQHFQATSDDVATLGQEAVWPLPTHVEVDRGELDQFCTQFAGALGGAPLTVEQVESVQFQTKEDWHRYAFAPGAIGYHLGTMRVTPPMWKSLEQPARDLTHALRPEHDPAAAPLKIALFADFGNGTYAARAIARQLVAARLPYAFHLGDVYYGGSAEEFDDYFRKPLRGLLDTTELFMIAGNHELYAKGQYFQEYLREKAQSHPQLQRQNGEMFRLKGPGFQILGIDTMWTDWKGGKLRSSARLDDESRAVLRAWLDDRESNQLTILLTSDHPWDVGKRATTRLLSDVREHVDEGRIHLWLWGNVHYAALYERWQAASSNRPGFVGSCIGHGGYPFYTMERGKLPNGVKLRWLETRHRFWPFEHLRPDVGLNGWCEMTLRREGNTWRTTLTYRDWVGRDRAVAQIRKGPRSGVEIESFEEA